MTGMPCLLGAPLERGDLVGHRQRVLARAASPLGELQVVDDVDQQQRDVGLVRRVAVQVFVLGGHPLVSPALLSVCAIIFLCLKKYHNARAEAKRGVEVWGRWKVRRVGALPPEGSGLPGGGVH